jgi:DNA gyrase subunit A
VGATTEKTGAVIGAFTLSEEQKGNSSVILISRSGQTVRLPLDSVRVTGRTTQGVILAKLKDNDDGFTSATVVQRSEEDDIDDTTTSSENISL